MISLVGIVSMIFQFEGKMLRTNHICCYGLSEQQLVANSFVLKQKQKWGRAEYGEAH